MTAAGRDFLATMAHSSRARAEAARAREPEAALRARALATPVAPPLVLDGRFDLIAELKLRSPAQGLLSTAVDDLERRVTAYADSGAAIVSVLTEPDRFDGDLLHLARASAALRPYAVPAMRKDFLVDPYQLLEARAAGAGGALLIVRMLERGALDALARAAADLGLFVLLEAFDEADVAIAAEVAHAWRGRPGDCLVGVNSRDLVTLEVVPERLEQIAPCLPRAFARVAESGLATPDDAARLARAGYTVALVGTALMSAADPRVLGAEMIARGRSAAPGAPR